MALEDICPTGKSLPKDKWLITLFQSNYKAYFAWDNKRNWFDRGCVDFIDARNFAV
jgi:hypothetical protein